MACDIAALKSDLAAVKDFHNEFVSIHAEEIGKLNQLKADLAAAKEANTKLREELQIAVDRLRKAASDLAVYANEARRALP